MVNIDAGSGFSTILALVHIATVGLTTHVKKLLSVMLSTIDLGVAFDLDVNSKTEEEGSVISMKKKVEEKGKRKKRVREGGDTEMEVEKEKEKEKWMRRRRYLEEINKEELEKKREAFSLA